VKHEPVLFNEVVELLRPATETGVVVDATVGLGGHAEGLLERYEAVTVLGIDRDPRALEQASRRLARYGPRAVLVQGRHEAIIDILEAKQIQLIDGLLADLGLSSMQLDDPERGFSFRFDSALDMRMGEGGATAADLINTLPEAEIGRILHDFGEEPMARRIAHAIVVAREESPIATTGRLSAVIRSVKRGGREKIDPSTLTFQALRIAVNQELVGLESFLRQAIGILRPGARIGVIAFHSLEDRIVKGVFRSLTGQCSCPPGLPICVCGAEPTVRLVRSRAIEASEEEVDRNPRSRSARLRVAERV